MNAGILSLPDEILDNILSYTTYDEVSGLRLVCKRFDASAQRVLNQGFYRVEKYHAQCLRKVKEQLPRRESERRKHPLSAHCDILTAIETRLSLLGMTFMKYVDLKYCCFIPGKVLDEIFKILRFISTTPVSPRSHEILQELRDISSMAMEHFDEKIVPAFRNRRNQTPKLSIANLALTESSHLYTSSSSSLQAPPVSHELVKIHNGYKQLQSKHMELKRENLDIRKKIIDYRKKLNDLDRKTSKQNHVMFEQATRISEQDGKINEMNRKLVDFDKYVSDLLLNLKEEQGVGVILDKTSQDKRPSESHSRGYGTGFLSQKRQRQVSSCIPELKNKRLRTRSSSQKR